jgi:hypothetical protein
MYKALDQSVAHSEKLSKLSDFAYVWAQGLALSDMVGTTANPVVSRQGFRFSVRQRRSRRLLELKRRSATSTKPTTSRLWSPRHEDYSRVPKPEVPTRPAPLPSLAYATKYLPTPEGRGATLPDGRIRPFQRPLFTFPFMFLFMSGGVWGNGKQRLRESHIPSLEPWACSQSPTLKAKSSSGRSSAPGYRGTCLEDPQTSRGGAESSGVLSLSGSPAAPEVKSSPGLANSTGNHE